MHLQQQLKQPQQLLKAALRQQHSKCTCQPQRHRNRRRNSIVVRCAVQPGGGRHDTQHLADALQAVTQHLQLSNQQWLQRCLERPLVYRGEDGAGIDSSPKVYALCVCFFAPLQHELVAAALQQLQPDEVLIEQPPPPSNTGLLLPHPQWVQAALDHEQCWQQQDRQQQPHLEAFESELAASAPNPPAKVGKDIMDPYETFGYYGGLEYGQRPAALARVLQRCGFLPGREVVDAVQHALHQGARLRCIDAPLKLQESWVRGLVGAFTNQLDEAAVNSYQPLKDFNANQAAASTHLPDAAAEWDKALAGMAAHLQQQQQQQQQAAAASDASTAAAAAQQAAEQEALLLFKVSKATAAALLPPDDTLQAEVLSRMQRLQPLKWRHFALRQQHMAQQIKEAALLATKQAQGRSSNSSSSSSSQPTLLVVVGRQHCAALNKMWSDPASSLWATQVPRSFAPSVVEPQQQQGAATGEDSSSSSSRSGSSSSN